MPENRGLKTEVLPRLCRAIILSSVLCPLSSAPAHAAPPAGVQATYDVYRNSLKIGQIDETFARDKDRYTLTSITRAKGLLAIFKRGRIIIGSEGLVNSNGLRPLRFSDKREGEERRNRNAEFNWEAKQLTLIQLDQRNVVALPEGTQDRLSAMYQFMFLTLRPFTSMGFPMTNGGKLDDYHYAITSGQKLTLPAGEFETLYLDSQPQKKGDSRTEIWLAAERHNLPCKMIVTTPDGDQFIQVLSRLSILP